MLDEKDRHFVKHQRSLFKKELLFRLMDYFDQLEKKFEKLTNITEREGNAISRGESADVVRMNDFWYDIWCETGAPVNLAELFYPYALVTYPVQVRHVKADTHKVPWHQDIAYMRLLKEKGHQQIITCFIPLEENPSLHTTVEFAFDNVLKGDFSEFPHKMMEGFGAGIDEGSFSNRQHFNLELGDALIFGDHALHRTFTPDGCNVQRRSLEFRLIQKNHALPGKDYFDLEKKAFLKSEDLIRSKVHE